MKKKKFVRIKPVLCAVFVCVCVLLLWSFREQTTEIFVRVAAKSAKLYLPQAAITIESKSEKADKAQLKAAAKVSKAAVKEEDNGKTTQSFGETPKDIVELMNQAKQKSKDEKKDGDISDWQYTNEGVTDEFGAVKVKNVNKTRINIEKLLAQKADLSVSGKEPSVLIFHTHTTETFQLVERDYYPVNNIARSEKEDRNMVRIGKSICEQLEKAGIGYIHDTKIHDARYTGAYDNSRKTVEEYLKKNPSIQVVLDVHRDAIERTDGTKIRPVAKINGKKAAQIMIISGCQEEGNGITEFPDWEQNLVFALQLQKVAEESFEGLMRPLYFCPRMYNMNLTHCSLLLEVGSDSNTLEQAEYAGQCIGNALAKLLKSYTEE